LKFTKKLFSENRFWTFLKCPVGNPGRKFVKDPFSKVILLHNALNTKKITEFLCSGGFFFWTGGRGKTQVVFWVKVSLFYP